MAITASAQDASPSTFAPNPEIQQRIQAAIASSNPESLADDPTTDLIPQLVWFSSHADNTREAMAAGTTINRLHVSRESVIAALIPHLSDADKRFNASIRTILAGYEGRTATRGPDFSIYRELIETPLRAGEQPPQPLVQYMYGEDPGAALLLMMRASNVHDPAQIKPILWAEHTVADTLWKQRYGFLDRDAIEPAAAEQLDRLAAHEAWWARLYVAEIMRQHAPFHTDATIKRLATDPDARVRTAAARIRD